MAGNGQQHMYQYAYFSPYPARLNEVGTAIVSDKLYHTHIVNQDDVGLAMI